MKSKPDYPYSALRAFAESEDCDKPGWVSSEIESALDEIQVLRAECERLRRADGVRWEIVREAIARIKAGGVGSAAMLLQNSLHGNVVVLAAPAADASPFSDPNACPKCGNGVWIETLPEICASCGFKRPLEDTKEGGV